MFGRYNSGLQLFYSFLYHDLYGDIIMPLYLVDDYVDLSDRNVDLLYISVQNIGHFVFFGFFCFW